MKVKRGDIVLVNLDNGIGSVQRGCARWAMIVQNDIGNKYAPTSICIPFTTKIDKRRLLTHVNINKSEFNKLEENSTLIAEQIITVDEKQIFKKMGEVENFYSKRIDKAIMVSLGLRMV